MADYAEVPDYVDQITRAAIDAHMREFAANYGPRWANDNVSLTQQGNDYVLDCFNWSETVGEPVTVTGPDAAGWGGGVPSARIANFANPGSYAKLMQDMNQTTEFQIIREWVRQAAMQGNGAHYWGGLPDPSLFGDTITALDQAAVLLDVTTGVGIKWHIDRIRDILDGTIGSDGSTRTNAQPMKGDVAQALREMLCGFKASEDQSDMTDSARGSLPKFCLSAHDLVVTLKSGAQIEQQLWQAARADVATVTSRTIGKFVDWQPSGRSVNLAPFVDGMALAAVGAATIPGGQGAGVLLGVVAGLTQLIIDFTPSPTANEATSVDDMLRAFVLALNGGMSGWDYDASIFNAIKTLETALRNKIIDRRPFTEGKDENGHSFMF